MTDAQTDGQTDTPPIAQSRSNIAERDNKFRVVRYNGGLDPLVVSNFNFYF